MTVFEAALLFFMGMAVVGVLVAEKTVWKMTSWLGALSALVGMVVLGGAPDRTVVSLLICFLATGRLLACWVLEDRRL